MLLPDSTSMCELLLWHFPTKCCLSFLLDLGSLCSRSLHYAPHIASGPPTQFNKQPTRRANFCACVRSALQKLFRFLFPAVWFPYPCIGGSTAANFRLVSKLILAELRSFVLALFILLVSSFFVTSGDGYSDSFFRNAFAVLTFEIMAGNGYAMWNPNNGPGFFSSSHIFVSVLLLFLCFSSLFRFLSVPS